MRVGLFGGSFDPIHNGHLIMARDAKELLNLDRVIFLPAAISPHKLHRAPASAEIRRAMVESAIADEPGFGLDDRELHRSGPSYTIDTVEEIRKELPGCDLVYLIGYDNLAKLHTWYRIEDLRAQVEFVVFGRGEAISEHAFRKLPRRLDISATEIRQRVARGMSIRYLVPDPVRLLIKKYRVYISDSDDSR